MYNDPNADLRITPEGRAATARFIAKFRAEEAAKKQSVIDKRAKYEAQRLDYLRKLLGFTQEQRSRAAREVAA